MFLCGHKLSVGLTVEKTCFQSETCVNYPNISTTFVRGIVVTLWLHLTSYTIPYGSTISTQKNYLDYRPRSRYPWHHWAFCANSATDRI